MLAGCKPKFSPVKPTELEVKIRSSDASPVVPRHSLSDAQRELCAIKPELPAQCTAGKNADGTPTCPVQCTAGKNADGTPTCPVQCTAGKNADGTPTCHVPKGGGEQEYTIAGLCSLAEDGTLKGGEYKIKSGGRDNDGCTLKGKNFTLIGASEKPVSGYLHLEDVENVTIKGITFGGNYSGTRIRVRGETKSVAIVENKFPHVGPSRYKVCNEDLADPGAIKVDTKSEIDRLLIHSNIIGEVVPCRTAITKHYHAHGILVSVGAGTASNVRVERNTVSNADTGWSEVITLVGDIENFLVAQNSIQHFNNIGIDIAGATRSNAGIPRHGVVSDNLVAYWQKTRTNEIPGFGIYADGARNTCMTRNVAFRTKEGIEISSENCGNFYGNIMADNVVVAPKKRGIRIGTSCEAKYGCTASCDLDASCHGKHGCMKSCDDMAGCEEDKTCDDLSRDRALISISNISSLNNWLVQHAPQYEIQRGSRTTLTDINVNQDNIYCIGDSEPSITNHHTEREPALNKYCGEAQQKNAPQWAKTVSSKYNELDPCSLFNIIPESTMATECRAQRTRASQM